MRAYLLCVPLALAACPKADAPTREAPSPQEVAEDMHVHGALGDKARDFVIAGDLAAAKEIGQTLAGHNPVAQPPASLPAIGELQAAARVLADAPNLGTAADGVAGIAGACGSCHEATGAHPTYTFDPIPAEEKEVSNRMGRHQWAAQRMWEGLIAADPALYRLGADALSGPPLWGADPLPKAVAVYEAQVKEVASEAAAAGTPTARQATFARFIATCAGCHAVARP